MSSPTFELKSRVIRAGAGAGKTRTLIDTIIRSALEYHGHYKRFPRIVITTFTRKATQEIRERLLKKALDPSLKEELNLEFKESDREKLLMFVTSHSYIHISTIHGILFKFLTRYGHLSDLGPEIKIEGGGGQRQNLKKMLAEALLEPGQDLDFLQYFSFDQLAEMVESFDEATCIFDRVARFSITDLQKDADQFQNTIFRQLQLVLSRPEIFKTASTKKVHDLLLDLQSFSQASFSQFRQVVNDSIGPVRKPTFSKDADPEAVLNFGALWENLKCLRTRAYDPVVWDKYEAVSASLEGFFYNMLQRLEAHKLKTGSLNLKDLEYLSLKLLKRNPALGDRFSKDYDYWMIDEFQDTSPVQVQLLSRLKGDQPSFIVGDPQQSIYLFRGARSEVFELQEKTAKSLGVDAEYLRVNYRSEPELLLFFNYFFSKFSRQFQPMTPNFRIPADPLKVVATLYLVKEVEENSPEATVDAEALAALTHIQKLSESGVPFSQICVLARKNATLLSLAQTLKQRGVPYHLSSSGRFFERREVKDLLQILKFLINPHDDLTLLSILRSPWFLTPDDWIVATKRASTGSFWKAVLELAELPEGPRALHDLALLAQTRSLCECLEQVLRARILDYGYAMDKSGQWEANLWKAMGEIKKWEQQRDFDILDFMSRMAETFDSESNEEGEAPPVYATERIELMTIHGSKGLQFEHVIILDQGVGPKGFSGAPVLVDEATGQWTLTAPFVPGEETFKTPLFEKIKQEYKLREKAESDRVLYVAMTRAIKTVALVLPETFDKGSWAEAFPLVRDESVVNENGFTYEIIAWDRPSKTSEPFVSPALWGGVVDPSLGFISEKMSVTSVTDLVSKEKKPAFKTSSYSKLKKIVLGNRVHELLQKLRYASSLDNVEFSTEDIQEGLREALAYLLNLDQAPLRYLLRNGFAEWGFTVQREDQILRGQIDLWGFDEAGDLWIVDYKTGNPKNHEAAIAQLKLYQQALKICGHTGANRTWLVAVYPFHEQTFVESSP